MSLTSSPSFWNLFLAANPNFAGFGTLSAPVCILSDTFTAAQDADELEIMFQLERVSSIWKEKMQEEPLNPSTLNYLPDYCHHHLNCALDIHKLNLAKESCFFVTLTIDFYYENAQVWKHKLKEKLLAYQPLLSSYAQLHFASRWVEEADFKAVFQDATAVQLHFNQLPIR